MTDKQLSGKVAIISGAGSSGGIGALTARRMAERGAKVILTGLPNTGVEERTAEIVADGLPATSFIVDIAEEDQVIALMAFVKAEFGKLDILDNNAALQGQPEDLGVMTMDVEIWDRTLKVNGRGTMLMCKHAIPLMIENGGGSIINISSGTSMAGDFQSTAYGVSKGAINTLTKYIATQYGAQGVRCNAIAVGLIKTPALDAGMPEDFQQVFAVHKLSGRLGRPDDISSMVCFLASDETEWINGQILPVDGGFYAHVPTTVGVAQKLAQMQAAVE